MPRRSLALSQVCRLIPTAELARQVVGCGNVSIHHRGRGRSMVAGEEIRLPLRKK
jgi:hypothetical protein